ncbi:hypothetical protein F5Y05DRAFT_192245 [Hypoxylon sp. FL0543]|nr:hypothetical protein F5Y05DRAFT_192245 [Hypoxylon sp. FL0543]
MGKSSAVPACLCLISCIPSSATQSSPNFIPVGQPNLPSTSHRIVQKSPANNVAIIPPIIAQDPDDHIILPSLTAYTTLLCTRSTPNSPAQSLIIIIFWYLLQTLSHCCVPACLRYSLGYHLGSCPAAHLFPLQCSSLSQHGHLRTLTTHIHAQTRTSSSYCTLWLPCLLLFILVVYTTTTTTPSPSLHL